MLSDSSIAFLKRLLDTPGPSGFEGAPARVWRAEAATFTSDIRADVVGNSLATVHGTVGTDAPNILLAGHIDEIGVIVTHIDEVLGAVGASGGTGDEDEAVCIAGVEAAGLAHG